MSSAIVKQIQAIKYTIISEANIFFNFQRITHNSFLSGALVDKKTQVFGIFAENIRKGALFLILKCPFNGEVLTYVTQRYYVVRIKPEREYPYY